MSNEYKMDRIERAFVEGTPIDRAIEKGVRAALRRHKLLGFPIAIWKDGKPVWIPPEEIDIGE